MRAGVVDALAVGFFRSEAGGGVDGIAMAEDDVVFSLSTSRITAVVSPEESDGDNALAAFLLTFDRFDVFKDDMSLKSSL